MTRIIGGTARGRRLAVPASGTRPTSDRVREAMFSTIDSQLRAEGRDWSDVTVLDLFAGSGALGLEAVSRGASSAVLVERSRASARVATANAELVGSTGVRVLVRDARQLPADPAAGASNLCLVDPPYEWAAADIAELLGGLVAAGWVAAGAMVVVERPGKDSRAPMPTSWGEPRRRSYGDTALWYGRATGEDRPADHRQGDD